MTEQTWMPHIDSLLCHSCGTCIANCDAHALDWDTGQHAALMYPERCVYCGTCENNCPNGAIELPLLICFNGKDA